MAHQSQGGPTAYVTSFSPEPEIKIKDPVDTSPSDIQPPGVDDDEPQSLEEALTGWVGEEAPQSRTSFSLVRALTRIPLAV